MNIEELTQAAAAVLDLTEDYSSGDNELQVDRILYGYLAAVYGRMSRQLQVRFYNQTRPSRIDYRHGGPNPVVIELVVRPRRGGGQLWGSQNNDELQKLCRVPTSRAKLRVLLLMDLTDRPYTQEQVQDTYRLQRSSRGNYVRHSVRVIYVSKTRQFNFLWRP